MGTFKKPGLWAVGLRPCSKAATIRRAEAVFPLQSKASHDRQKSFFYFQKRSPADSGDLGSLNACPFYHRHLHFHSDHICSGGIFTQRNA